MESTDDPKWVRDKHLLAVAEIEEEAIQVYKPPGGQVLDGLPGGFCMSRLYTGKRERDRAAVGGSKDV